MQPFKLLPFPHQHVLNDFLHVLQLVYLPAALLQGNLKYVFSSASPWSVQDKEQLLEHYTRIPFNPIKPPQPKGYKNPESVLRPLHTISEKHKQISKITSALCNPALCGQPHGSCRFFTTYECEHGHTRWFLQYLLFIVLGPESQRIRPLSLKSSLQNSREGWVAGQNVLISTFSYPYIVRGRICH